MKPKRVHDQLSVAAAIRNFAVFATALSFLSLLIPGPAVAIVSEKYLGKKFPQGETQNRSVSAEPAFSSGQLERIAAFVETAEPTADVKIDLNKKSGIPVWINATAIISPEQLAAHGAGGGYTDVVGGFLKSNKSFLKLEDPAEELTVVGEFTDSLGDKHTRLQQTYKGIPLWGKEISLHQNQKGAIYLFSGNNEATPDGLDITPRLSEQDALHIARSNLGQGAGDDDTAYMVIYADDDGEKTLAYRVTVAPDMGTNWSYMIDAKSGKIIYKINNICSVGGTLQNTQGKDTLGNDIQFKAWLENNSFFSCDPSYPLADPPYQPLQKGISQTGDMFVLNLNNQDPSSKNFKPSMITIPRKLQNSGQWDPAVVSAMNNTFLTYQYFLKTFNRNSIDGNGHNMITFVHIKQKYNNAFWNGKAVFFGDGDGKIFRNLTGALDITAHEWTHGLTSKTAQLEYKFQSGALNESYSDVFAAMVDRDDWTIGEDITIPAPGYLRDMANPAVALSKQPTKMSEYVKLPIEKDNGGVHVNCSIPNRAAYLIAEGLTVENLGESIGREDLEKIYYRALTVYLKKNSQFIDARRFLVQSAQDLFGANSKHVLAVHKAWDAIEVFDDQAKPPVPNKPRKTPQKEKKPDPPQQKPKDQKPQSPPKEDKGGWINVIDG